MPVNFVPQAELLRILPEIILTVVATLIMVLEVLVGNANKHRLGALALAGLLAARWGAVCAFGSPGPACDGMLLVDGFATFFRVLVIGVGILATLSSFQYLKREGVSSSEYYALLLYSVAGQSIMAASNELIMIFIG